MEEQLLYMVTIFVIIRVIMSFTFSPLSEWAALPAIPFDAFSSFKFLLSWQCFTSGYSHHLLRLALMLLEVLVKFSVCSRHDERNSYWIKCCIFSVWTVFSHWQLFLYILVLIPLQHRMVEWWYYLSVYYALRLCKVSLHNFIKNILQIIQENPDKIARYPSHCI